MPEIAHSSSCPGTLAEIGERDARAAAATFARDSDHRRLKEGVEKQCVFVTGNRLYRTTCLRRGLGRENARRGVPNGRDRCYNLPSVAETFPGERGFEPPTPWSRMRAKFTDSVPFSSKEALERASGGTQSLDPSLSSLTRRRPVVQRAIE